MNTPFQLLTASFRLAQDRDAGASIEAGYKWIDSKMPFSNSNRRQWAAAGLSATAGSAAVAHPPPSTHHRLYYFTSFDHGMSDIEMGHLKISRIKDLNDPFELLALNVGSMRLRRVVDAFRSDLHESTGFVSFSEDWKSPLMWGHYTGNNTGMCLGFDVRRSKVAKVVYKPKRLTDVLPDPDNPPSVISSELRELLLTTKCSEWQYEREYRLITTLRESDADGKLHFRKFDSDLKLAEVILGLRSERSLEKLRLRVVARWPSAITFRARIAWKFFAIVPDEKSVI